MSNSRLLISFSGGETSALMAKLLMERTGSKYDEVRTVFANTGQEREETLQFVDKCDKVFGLNVVWIEAAPERGLGASCNVVNYETADRVGGPFESVIKEYGIPNSSWPHCSRELKSRPIARWARDNGWTTGTYDTAIGIRRDEIDRMSASAAKARIIYPLISMFPRTKPMVNEFWQHQPFRLEIAGYQGNCKWCWKKSLRKHLTIVSETPEAYDFPEDMERRYPLAGYNSNGEPRVFFRDNRSTQDIRRLAKELKFSPADDDSRQYQTSLLNLLEGDLDSCGSESCEIPIESEEAA